MSAKNLDSWAPGIGSIGLGHFTQLSAVILIQGYHSSRKQCSQLCDSGVDLGTMLGLGDYLGVPLGSGPPEGKRGKQTYRALIVSANLRSVWRMGGQPEMGLEVSGSTTASGLGLSCYMDRLLTGIGSISFLELL